MPVRDQRGSRGRAVDQPPLGRRTALRDRPEEPLLAGALRADDEREGAARGAERLPELRLGAADRVGGRRLGATLRLGARRDGARRAELGGALLARLGAIRGANRARLGARRGVTDRVLPREGAARVAGAERAGGAVRADGLERCRFERVVGDGRLAPERRLEGAVRAQGVAALEGAERAVGVRVRVSVEPERARLGARARDAAIERVLVRPCRASGGRALGAVL